MNAPDFRRLGMLPHQPISTSGYDWYGGQPFDVQRRTVEMLTENPRAFVLSSQGTGKTKAAIWAFDYLQRTGSAKRMLVVAPLSTLTFTWAREILSTVSRLRYVVLHASTPEKRRKLLAEPADIYIINHDGLTIMEADIMARTDIDVLCIDECAIYRNKAKRTHAIQRVAAVKHIVWGMTGSPTPNAPTDVYWQAKIICPHNVPKYYGTFREQTMLKVNQFKWVPRAGSQDVAVRTLQPNVRFTLDDVAELPPFISRRQDVALSLRQAKIYREIRKDAYAMVQSGEIKAANAAAVMSKLQQISLGWVYLHGGKVAELDASERIKTLIDIIEAAERKVIVFVPFKHAMEGVAAALTAHGKTATRPQGITNVVVSGDTPLGARSKAFSMFQNTAEPKVLVAHPQCLAHGITLTAADTIVWFAPITSSEIYTQANARIRRVGQNHKQLFLHLQSTPVERHIYDLLINKIDGQDNLLKLLELACKE
jgi:SNF2 family DNA or RNA helicase